MIEIAVIQDLIENGRFELGSIAPWKGVNARVISKTRPRVDGVYCAALKGGNIDASIEQLVNVLPGETYQFIASLATDKKGYSPPLSITLEFLDENLNKLSNGLEAVIGKGQLPNGKKGTFKMVTHGTEKVPHGTSFAKLIIRKMGCEESTGVIIDNIVLKTNMKEE